MIRVMMLVVTIVNPSPIPDEQRSRILTMADIFKTMFQDIVSLVNESTSTFNQGESSSTLPSESKSNTTGNSNFFRFCISI